MRSKVAWLRASYWAGAVADVGIGVLALVPSRMSETAYRYPMGLAASLMFAWPPPSSGSATGRATAPRPIPGCSRRCSASRSSSR